MRRRGGFSLVELLVAIAIIGILSAILFPVFISARERAKRSFCVNNMREAYFAMQMYADDNYGYLPSPKDISVRQDGSYQTNGFGLLYKYVKNKNVFLCPNAEIPNSARLGERVYTVLLPDKRTWTCSYNLLSDYYGERIASSSQANASDWKPGRLDVNLTDRNLRLFEECSWDRARLNDAVQTGGPLIDNHLHLYGEEGRDRLGILFINLKGSVHFVPTSKYPFIK